MFHVHEDISIHQFQQVPVLFCKTLSKKISTNDHSPPNSDSLMLEL